MSAVGYVGRVGGLAVALGIGSALIGGAPAAFADGSAAGGVDSARGESSAAPRPTRPTGGARERTARQKPDRLRAAPGGAQAAAAARADRDPSPRKPAPSPPPPKPGNTTDTAPAVQAVAPAPASVLNSGGTADRLVDSKGDGLPAPPIDAAAGWAALGVARRQAGPLFGSSVSVNPEVSWSDGLLLGTLNATSARDLPLTYTVVGKPSLGGKITWAPSVQGTRPDQFSYLPYMSTLTDPAQTERFKVLAAEVTGFDRFLSRIPIVGALWDPVLKTLHRLPIVNTLLAPIIGGAQVATFDEAPSALAAGRPVAFTYLMPSFDGVLISVNYFPATNVATGAAPSAPTVLNGPDLGFPGNTDVFSTWDTSLVNIVPGLVALRNDASPLPGGYSGGGGYNVITWDPRGEWASGGRMQLDNPNFEGRDVSSIISWATGPANVAQSQIATDQSGDPYVGMVGGSYGGGIQLVVAGTPDRRVDAIVPSIAWNTLNESLYPGGNFKTAIGSELLLALVATGARLNPQIYAGIASGVVFGVLSDSSQALLTNSGPGILANNITAPTLFLQGTPDILFELNAATTNGEMITTANPGVPVKTVWFCGGHGVCLLPSELQSQQGGLNMNNTLMWLDQYVAKQGTPADQIPTFQWFDQTGRYHSSDLNPFDPAFNDPTGLTYTGEGGRLLLVPLLGGSGPSQSAIPPDKPTVFSNAFALASGSAARNALNLDVAPPVGTVIAGTPTLSFSYRGLGTSRAVYAQLVDDATGQVLGNVVTPVTVTLDGRQRTANIPMADIAYTVDDPGDSMTLQLTSSALPYADLLTWGSVRISDVKLDVPTVA